jgi:hypothetical protein
LFKEVAAVGVDKDDNVYCFNRGDHPMMVFDRDGNFLRSWGEGEYPRAPAGNAQLQQHFAVLQPAFADEMAAVCRTDRGLGRSAGDQPGRHSGGYPPLETFGHAADDYPGNWNGRQPKDRRCRGSSPC